MAYDRLHSVLHALLYLVNFGLGDYIFLFRQGKKKIIKTEYFEKKKKTLNSMKLYNAVHCIKSSSHI